MNTTQRNDILQAVWSHRLIIPGAMVNLSTEHVHLHQLWGIVGPVVTVYEPQSDRFSQRQGRHIQARSLRSHHFNHQ
jgi:hypothetical protein